ncbi:MAG: hypothetical protein WCG20_03310 [bacterium]
MITDLILSLDTEFNGDIPGINSLWSIGAAAFSIEKDNDEFKPKLIDQFEVHLNDLPGTIHSQSNMEFWEQHQQAWQYCRENSIEPKRAIELFDVWLHKLPKKYIVATWPANADVGYVEYYFERFLKKRPFPDFLLDLRSYSFAMLKQEQWKDAGMKDLPEGWKPYNPTPHRACADAIAQGYLACNLIIANLK